MEVGQYGDEKQLNEYIKVKTMKQRKIEWLDITKNNAKLVEYHKKQLKETYKSTVAFCDWLESIDVINKDAELKIVDIGCGAGGNIAYMSKLYHNCDFLGIDLNPDVVKWGNEYFQNHGLNRCKLENGDIYKLKKRYIGKFDGLVSYQTLSYLPEYKTPLIKMMELKPKWIALTSLFFDGDVNCKIEIQDYTQPLADKPFRETYYNVYSLELIKKLLKEHGYINFKYKWFGIDVDLPQPNSKGMGTYTQKLADGRRIQRSGPVLMDWYFVYAEKL